MDWGDATAHTTFPTSTQGSLGSQSHTYAAMGNYTVSVKVTDKDGQFDTKTFQVSVSPALDAVNDTASVIANSANNPINVLQNDTPSNATITAVQSPTDLGGTASSCSTCVSGGPGISYTPPNDYVGGDTFTYTITDGAGHFDTATVTMTVQGSGTMDSSMFLEDADLHDLDGSFDVLFGKSPRPYDTSHVRIKSTSPGTHPPQGRDQQQHERQLRRRAHEPRIGGHHRAGHAGELRSRRRRLLQPEPGGQPGPDLREAGVGAPGPQPSGQGQPGRQDRRHARGHPVQGLVDRRRLREPGRLQLLGAGGRGRQVHQDQRLRDPEGSQGEDQGQVRLPAEGHRLAGEQEAGSELPRRLQLRPQEDVHLRLRDAVRTDVHGPGQRRRGRRRQEGYGNRRLRFRRHSPGDGSHRPALQQRGRRRYLAVGAIRVVHRVSGGLERRRR